MKTGYIHRKSMNPCGLRFDSSYHLSDGVAVKRVIASSPYPLMPIEKAADRIFIGGRARRVYVKDREHGIPFLSSSDILQADLEAVKLASKKYTPNVEDMKLQKGWTLITRSGTIGNCAFANAKHAQKLASEDVIRLVPNNILREGYIYAYLASKQGYSLLTQGTFGAVIQHIEPAYVASLPIPVAPESFQQEVDDLIQESARLREEAADMLSMAKILLKRKANLKDLTPDDYDYYGPRTANRKVSCFSISRKNITTTTINAFNLSERIKNAKSKLNSVVSLKETLISQTVFSTGSFPRVKVSNDKGIMLINQSDIFDTLIKGKRISRRNVKIDNLVNYGEVLIAGVGTLGDSEKFCHVIYANEDLVGQLVSGEFIRMKTIQDIPSGYLFAWLDTDFGFRFIRNTQAGTKLCRPIPKLLLEIPVPIIDKESMLEIDKLVREAHTKRYQANCNERQAISMIEQEIESWTK